MSDLSVLDPDFEARSTDAVRRATDDIKDCVEADVSISWPAPGVPVAEFAFRGHPSLSGRPLLAVQLVALSKSRPLQPGRIINGDELRRHVRSSVEAYLKANGIEITRKVFHNALL